MPLKELSLKDKKLCEKFLNLSPHELSVYAFENIYIWKGIFDIYWKLMQDNLCIFFQDRIGCFLYLPPLGERIKKESLEEAFGIMDKFNRRADISRIENVEEKSLSLYRDLGYACEDKYVEYLCKRTDLVELKGNKFKSKRACFNYFIKHYTFEYLPFSLRQKDECLKLYNRWMKARRLQNQDPVYQGMLGDSRRCLKILLDDYRNLGCVGRIVKINDRIKAFTFGFKLTQDTFCILYEITDLSVNGLSQFIFREFCRELTDYKYINIMDDSGLANLKRVKLSYQPTRLIPSYIVKRKNTSCSS
jgi:hypothetical protein